jgi:hypothetical protein
MRCARSSRLRHFDGLVSEDAHMHVMRRDRESTMSNRLYVGNLSFHTGEESLRDGANGYGGGGGRGRGF